MGFYQAAGIKTTPPDLNSITRDQFNDAMAKSMYGVSYKSLPKGSIDVLAEREWPKFLAGQSDYQFLAERINPAFANTPMSARQAVQTPPYQPALGFMPPDISEDEMFPNPPSTGMPMSPYAQSAMDQVTGTYANQGMPDMGQQTSPYAQLMMAQATGNFGQIPGMLPGLMNNFQQTTSNLTTSPELEGEDEYMPRTSGPDRWDRKVAREQARNIDQTALGTGPTEPGAEEDERMTFGEGLAMGANLFDPSRYSLEGTLYNIGRAIGDDSGNKGLRIGLGAASAAFKGGRNVLSGLAFSKASNEAKDWYEKQMRRVQYNPIGQNAYGYTGDVANAARGGVMSFQPGGTASVTYFNPVPKRTDLKYQGDYFAIPAGIYPIPTTTSNRKSNKPIITEKGGKSVIGSPYADDYYRFKEYQADNKGKLRSAQHESYYTNNVGGDRVISYPERYVTMDTLGYSQGRENFPVRVVEKNIASGFGGSYDVNEFEATRAQVPSLIKSMKNQTGLSNKEKVAANAYKVEQNRKKVEANKEKVRENQRKVLGLEMGGNFTSQLDFANDPRFQAGEYIEFEYGGKMYKGTIKENNGKTISLKWKTLTSKK